MHYRKSVSGPIFGESISDVYQSWPVSVALHINANNQQGSEFTHIDYLQPSFVQIELY